MLQKGEVITFVLSAVFVLLVLSISPTIPLKNTDDGVRGRCEEMCGFLLRSNKETLIFVKSFSDSVGSTEITIFESQLIQTLYIYHYFLFHCLKVVSRSLMLTFKNAINCSFRLTFGCPQLDQTSKTGRYPNKQTNKQTNSATYLPPPVLITQHETL